MREQPCSANVGSWLVSYWEERLQLASVPTDRALTDIGATSLRMVQMVADVEDRYGVELPAWVFMRGVSIDQLISLIASGGSS